MPSWEKIYCNPAGQLTFLALILSNVSLFSQTQEPIHPILIENPERLVTLALFSSKGSFSSDNRLIPAPDFQKSINAQFYDSLKSRASKNPFTRKLYDFVIVSEKSVVAQVEKQSSDLEFRNYSGKKIGSVTIRRLSVFGSDINDPLSANPNKLETFFNKTHLNTNELIIRKNLLFSEGDTISPLILSDNERILRQLPFIEDARIIAEPGSGDEVNLTVYTKDIYSLGLSTDIQGVDKGSVSIFDKNILGLGHEFKIDVPFNGKLPDSPGLGLSYNIDNISRSFINLNLNYYNGLGQKTFGFSLEKKLLSSTTKYAGGISVREMFTRINLDTLPQPEPLKYNLQDYWVERSFLLDRKTVSRLIVGARYTNNNVFNHPLILPNSYRYLQQYKMFLGSFSYSVQKYFKTSLLYAYGRTEDIPYGGLITITAGKEKSEYKERLYTGLNLSFGKSFNKVGYFYTTAGVSSFFNGSQTEEGLLMLRTTYFSDLIYLGSYKVRNFVRVDYTRGFDRYLDEHLHFLKEAGLSGLTNDSVGRAQRLSLSLESVLFSPRNYYGFRFAFFAFTDASCLFGTNEVVGNGVLVSAVGIGIRIRNDNLLLNTIQIKLGFYPNLPAYSKANYFAISGEQTLKPDNFDPGPPSTLVYR